MPCARRHRRCRCHGDITTGSAFSSSRSRRRCSTGLETRASPLESRCPMAPGSMSSTLLALTMTSTPWVGGKQPSGTGVGPWRHCPPPQCHPPGRTRRSWPRGWHRHICGRLARPHPPVAAREGLSWGGHGRVTPTPLTTTGQRDRGAPTPSPWPPQAPPLHPAMPLPTLRPRWARPGPPPPPSMGPPTHPVDEDIFGEHSLGVLDAAEAVHHLLDLKVPGELQQTSTWHSTISPRPPSTGMGAGENAGRAKPAAGTEDLTS